MKIKINHISKTEGQSSFAGALLQGNIAQAKIEVEEGARLIEALVLGRDFSQIPIITSRICGICPVIHNITAIKAIETAFAVKVTPDIVKLRQIMLLSQIIHSHALHLFFFSLPDFKGPKDALHLTKKYPRLASQVFRLRDFALSLLKVIAGRAVHPIASEVGGFKVKPDLNSLKKIISTVDSLLPDALSFANFFKNLKYPHFENSSAFVCLKAKDEYAVYDGALKASQARLCSPWEFVEKIIEKENGVVKRVKLKNESYFVGALARLNNNYQKLNPQARRLLKGEKFKIPSQNTFFNILAQAIEIVHCLAEIKNLWEKGIGNKVHVDYKVKAGCGLAACEAPRGTLFHYYEIDSQGIITGSNIITPTAQFLNNLEADLKKFLPQSKSLNKDKREARLKMLIRAYDPCFTCATH